MGGFIFRLLRFLCANELSRYILQFRDSHYEAVRKEKSKQATYINYPLGTIVIFRSNEPGPLIIGPVVEHSHLEDKILLGVKCRETRNVVYSLNNTPPYWTEERETALKKLSWLEQWNVLSKYHSMKEEEKAYKESPQYQSKPNTSESL